MEIKNCVAIVSGGASGMGLATARLLLELGAKVTILDKNIDALTDWPGLKIACDITKEDELAKALDKAKTEYGSARICINCAGIARAQRILGKEGVMPLAAFREVIEVNLIGSFNLMRLSAAGMQTLEPCNASGERGIIINTASIAAFEGQIGQAAYSASKGGIVSMTLPAAREFARFGIRVMAIAPGLVNTPMLQQIPEPAREALIANIPFPHRLADPNEFARLAQHIIENAMLNGETIRLDGALRMQ